MKELTNRQLRTLKEFDPVTELSDWAAFAANNSLQWKSQLHWNSSRATEAIHPSSLDNQCDMVLFLELVGGGSMKKVRPSEQMIYDVGTSVHEMLQYYQGTRARHFEYRYSSEAGFDYRQGTSFRHDLKMAGHADGVTYGWPIDEPILWEYKTIKDSAYQRLKSPSQNYVTQVHAYMVNLDVQYTIILYINKNDSSMAAFKVPFNPGFWKPHEARIKRIVKLAKDLKEPVKKIGRHCFKCRFYEECCPPVTQSTPETEDEELL